MEKPWDESNITHAVPERVLWTCVIWQALMDVSSGRKNSESKRAKEQAYAWLLGYSRDFQIVCDRAGLHPDYVRKRTVEILSKQEILR